LGVITVEVTLKSKWL